MSELEGAEVKVEGAEKPTELKAEPTVDITKTEGFRTELDKALGKGLESVNRQLSLQQAETKAAKAEAEMLKTAQQNYEEQLRELQVEAEKQFADDPEALKGYRNTKVIEMKEKRSSLKAAELERKEAELEGLRWAIEMHQEADRIQKERQVPRDVLESCTSKEQMDKIAQSFPEIKPDGGKEPDKPKFDSLRPSGGEDWHSLSSDEKIARGLSKK